MKIELTVEELEKMIALFNRHSSDCSKVSNEMQNVGEISPHQHFDIVIDSNLSSLIREIFPK